MRRHPRSARGVARLWWSRLRQHPRLAHGGCSSGRSGSARLRWRVRASHIDRLRRCLGRHKVTQRRRTDTRGRYAASPSGSKGLASVLSARHSVGGAAVVRPTTVCSSVCQRPHGGVVGCDHARAHQQRHGGGAGGADRLFTPRCRCG
uniref:Uncharacterized protein n=1 Tax=Setaria viridis TaxID=4556 RepID=A0A4U6UCU9_SETVI|nr:hypothetical protein SEVIR_5G124100v2 [Setaria viridis]